MREYELLYIVSGDKSESEASATQDSVTAALAEYKAKVTATDAWGRRRLAYDINKQSHGWYVIEQFTAEPARLPEVQRAINLNDAVVRSLIVNADDLPTEAEKAAQAERAEKYRSKSDDTDDKVKSAPRKAVAPPVETATPAAPKPKAPAKEQKKEKEAAPALSEAERKAKLEEKLGQILGDQDNDNNESTNA